MNYIKFEEIENREPKNDLEKYFLSNHNNRGIHKWYHYFEIYDRHFSSFRNKEVTILEIGVENGGSAQMWRNYFGEKSKVIGVDINPNCKQFEGDGIDILIGSQSDKNFWKNFKEIYQTVDIIIDDGGHRMDEQIITYEELFPHLNDNGIYLCEDLHTSYWSGYGGGYKKSGTFIEYSKNFIDYIHHWHDQQKEINYETKNIFGLHYYDSILVVEKRKIDKPFHTDNGIRTQNR